MSECLNFELRFNEWGDAAYSLSSVLTENLTQWRNGPVYSDEMESGEAWGRKIAAVPGYLFLAVFSVFEAAVRILFTPVYLIGILAVCCGACGDNPSPHPAHLLLAPLVSLNNSVLCLTGLVVNLLSDNNQEPLHRANFTFSAICCPSGD